MQIVRDLAGYTLGRSDLVRRAMSKKKAAVMEKERQNFVYGNPEEGVPGCIANGIDEKTANKIYDEMTDFAKYAFNKSHAAAYAVVSYQTAWLKYYYPVEYMAALMTSVIDNPGKVAEYIYSCRQMGIKILPPDINHGYSSFSVDNGSIRYGLAAIKSIGRPVIKEIVAEKYNHKMRNPFDLEPEEEVLIGRYAKEEWGSDFVFVTHYPSKKRPFYAMDDPEDPRYTLSFDLLFRGLEITTGGQRIHDYKMLIDKITARGMTEEGMEQYLATFKHGMPPHGGLGIGLERLTMQLLGEDNVRETTLFPRDLSRLEP